MNANRLDNLRTLRVANVDAAIAVSFTTLTTGAFLVGFVQLLGGSDLWIGLLSAIPSLVGVLQIPGAIWGRGFPSFKRFITPAGIIWRLCYVPMILLPLLAWPNDLRLALMATLVLVASAVIAVVQPIYNDWLAEMIPENSRGWYFARRNAIGAITGAIVGIIGGALLDGFRARQLDAQGFSVVFALGVVCGIVSLFFYFRMQDIPRPNPIRQPLIDGLRAMRTPVRDRTFRNVLIFLCFAITSQLLAGNLFTAFGRESLNLNFKILQGLAVSMAVGNVVSAPLWGFLSDKYGNKPILTLALLMVALNPLAWMLCIPGQETYNAILLLTTHILMGVGWAGVALCQFNLVLATAPTADRANYLGTGLTVMAVTGGVAPLLGAALMASLRTHYHPEIAYKILFGVSLVLRFASVGLLATVHESGAARFRTTLRDIRKISPRGMRSLKEMEGDAASREIALQSLGDRRLNLAADAVLQALQDPSPRVRRQAAATLAQLTDPRAAGTLAELMAEHPELIEEETVEALGEIGNQRSMAVLVPLLESPRSNLRRAAARAIGRVCIRAGNPDEGISALRRAAQADDIDLRRAALQALRTAGPSSGTDVIVGALSDPHPSVRIAAAEAIGELGIAAGDVIRPRLQASFDESSPELAYALSIENDIGDLDLIIRCAAAAPAVVGRKRALLAAARLLGVERPAYQLMLKSGIVRDNALIELAKTSPNPHFTEALQRYGNGQIEDAIRLLAEIDPRLKSLQRLGDQDTFVLAAVAASTVS